MYSPNVVNNGIITVTVCCKNYIADYYGYSADDNPEPVLQTIQRYFAAMNITEYKTAAESAAVL